MIVDLSHNYAKIGDTRLDLTVKEFRIIEFLALRKGAVLSKGAFLNHPYVGIDEPEPKINNVFMYKLRRKIADASASGVVIDTIWGHGYIFCEVRDYDTMTISAEMRLLHQTQKQNSGHSGCVHAWPVEYPIHTLL